MGKLFALLQSVLPQHLISRLVGLLAKSEHRLVKSVFISLFSLAYDINMEEAVRQEDEFVSFNDFFTRELKPEARPIGAGICSPADGRVSAVGHIKDLKLTQIKGQHYEAARLLGREDVAEFENGSFITIYLAPHNYHRVHCPVHATVSETRYIPGKLFSVNAATTKHIKDLFVKNERLVCELDTKTKPAALVMVGAMIVAGIRTRWRESAYPPKTVHEESVQVPLLRGDEVGQFLLGSTVVLLFQDSVQWQVNPGDPVNMGETIGQID